MHHRGEGAGHGREPALDGVRALAVALVLLFHGEVSWMPGGYLGVSLFFTLSGFLITRLLLDEVEHTGTIRVGAFYARRARRLLPASMLCLAGVVVAARAGEFEGVAHLRRDLLAALAQIYNWVQLGSGGSYGDLISRDAGIRSPLDHYWSLAIEEQFYWCWPVVLLGGVVWARRGSGGRGARRRALTRLVVGAAIAASLAALLIARVWGPDAAYWATPARAAEILLGAAAAALHASGRLQHVPAWTAPTGLLAIGALAVVLPADHGFAYEGGLVVVGLISATVLLGLRGPSLTRRLLSFRPLVAAGAVSYGLYLFHWPVFVMLDEARTGLDGPMLLACRIGLTTLVTVVSYGIIERPVRRAAWPTARTLVAGATASFAMLAVIAAAPAAAGDYWARDDAVAASAAITPGGSPGPLVPAPVVPTSRPPMAPTAAAPAAPESAAPAPPTVAPSRAVRILVIGDSTAEAAGAGLTAWAADNPALAQVSVLATGRCGMVRGGVVPGDAGDDTYRRNCDDLLNNRLLPAVHELRPDVVVVFVAARDSEPREWDQDEGVLTPTDSRHATRIEFSYRALTGIVTGASPTVKVVWVRPPTINPYWKDTGGAFLDAEGHAVVDSIAAKLAGDDPTHVAVVDLRAWMESTGYADRQDMRPDGIHFTPEAARQVAGEWLGPELVATALR